MMQKSQFYLETCANWVKCFKIDTKNYNFSRKRTEKKVAKGHRGTYEGHKYYDFTQKHVKKDYRGTHEGHRGTYEGHKGTYEGHKRDTKRIKMLRDTRIYLHFSSNDL